MDYSKATTEQLETICLKEPCETHYKYAAVRELELRSWKDSYLTDLIRLWGKGEEPWRIAEELGIDEVTVRRMARKYKLKRRQAI